MEKDRRFGKLILMGILSATVLGGCGESVENGGSASGRAGEDGSAQAEERSELEQSIADYELKRSSGEFTAEEYLALSGLYAQTGRIRKQRDLLEQSYRLNGDEGSFSVLQEIVVNIEEEDETVREEVRRLRQNLSTPEYQSEAVGMLVSGDWAKRLLPKLKEGRRRYYLEDAEGGTVLYLETGYDENGTLYSHIWYATDAGQATVLLQKADTVQLLTTGLTDGQLEGAFSSWLCIGSTGDIYQENGVLKNGVLVGDYTARVRYGSGSVDLFSLFLGREEAELATYTGRFTGDGTTALEQPEGLNAATGGESGACLVYAYNGDQTKCLFLDVQEGTTAGDYAFTLASFGIPAYPEFPRYEPAAEPEEEISAEVSRIRVRIYDSHIEWSDGQSWHRMGSAAEYAAEDPFRVYEEKEPDFAGTEGEGQNSGAGGSLSRRQASVEGTKKSAESQQPASGGSGKPTTPKSSASTPKTSAPSQTAPAQTAPAQTAPSQSAPAPSAPPSDSGAGDVDIEWTPDML
ncbi:MAG: hypothetical protein LBQ15_06700 [Clostridium sp.]|jgi:hypothetical protein|nr:hypothetical protein [Clostridium sp.]